MDPRRAQPADAPVMADVFAAAARSAWPFLGAARLAALRPPADAFRTRLEAGDAGLVVPGGFVLADLRAGEVLALAVAPERTRQGLGRTLLAGALGLLAGAGHAEASLWTEERNAGALAFYARLGWAADGVVRERTWHGAALRELRLRRPTTPSAAPRRGVSRRREGPSGST